MPGLDELKTTIAADLKANQATLKGLNDPADIVAHLKNTVWPFIEAFATNVVDEMLDLEATILEVAEGEGDMLSAETAGIFANHLMQSQALAAALRARLTTSPEDVQLGKAIDAYDIISAEVAAAIAEIATEVEEEDE